MQRRNTYRAPSDALSPQEKKRRSAESHTVPAAPSTVRHATPVTGRPQSKNKRPASSGTPAPRADQSTGYKTPKAPSRATPSRQVALDVLLRVLRDDAYLDRTLDATFKRVDLSARDRGLVTELTYGTLRRQIFIDSLISQYAKTPLESMPLEPLVSLRMGIYQLLYTRIPPHSAVDESVHLVRQSHPRMTGFANAVLRRIIREKPEANPADAMDVDIDTVETPSAVRKLARVLSFPEWIMAEVVAQRGMAGARAWAEATNVPPPLSLRIIGDPAARARIAQQLMDEGLEVELPDAHPSHVWLRGAGQVDTLPGFAEGLYTVQDAASSMVGQYAAPTQGSVVIDLCAAPGGKAAHLAELVGPSGQVLALDVHPGKARLITDGAERLHLSNVIVDVVDGTDTKAVRASLRKHTGRTDADLVLLDAPCAGLGTLRRHPELRVRRRDRQSLDSITTLQNQLLESAAQLVRPGGILVYSVCSLTRAEGIQRIKAFLARHPDYQMTDEPLQTWTDVHNGVDCFFAARMQRQADENLQA